MKFPIPRIIYKNIKDALNGEVMRLAKDIAKTLNVDEKLLLSEIKKDTLDLYPFEDDCEEDLDEMKCLAYEKKSNVYYPCKEPPIYDKNSKELYCHKHHIHHITKEQVKALGHEVLTILMYDNITYYLDEKNRIYDINLKLIGVYEEGNTTNSIITFKHDS